MCGNWPLLEELTQRRARVNEALLPIRIPTVSAWIFTDSETRHQSQITLGPRDESKTSTAITLSTTDVVLHLPLLCGQISKSESGLGGWECHAVISFNNIAYVQG